MNVVDDAVKEKWAREQNELKSQLILHDDFDWTCEGLANTSTNPLRYVGGVDISFVKGNAEDACACIVVVDVSTQEVVYEDFEMVKLTEPYIAGFLAFREVRFLVHLIEKLKKNAPEVFPQVIMVDGNGYLHQRGFGLACHLGVLTGIPTIGIGKTFYFVDGLDMKNVKRIVEERCHRGGDFVELIGNSGTVWGAAVRSHDDSTNCIFVSQGHKFSLPTALLVVQRCTTFRVPEPVRQADIRSRAFLRENF